MNVKLAVMTILVCTTLSQQTSLASEKMAPPTADQQKLERVQRAQTETPFGHASTAAPERVVNVVRGKTRYVNVKRLETVRITDGVSTVTWTFDTRGLPTFPLAKILPGSSGVTVYVDESPIYTTQ